MKEFLSSKGIAYEVKDIAKDKASAMFIIKKTRQRGVPVTQIGEKFIVGYDIDGITTELKEAMLL